MNNQSVSQTPGPRAQKAVTPKRSRTRKPAHLMIDLALQGGGSHGAFTWGVLDRLLEDERLEIAGISGTSAGAMNAVALAAGLMEGGRDGARANLRRLWKGVAAASPFHHLPSTPLDTFLGPANPWMNALLEPIQSYASAFTSQLSPYQFNPLNLNPLRQVLDDTVDFDRVRHCHKSTLFIGATEVRTGQLHVFSQAELNADMVLASACLPLLFQAVEINGEAYWDGGYAGNPALLPLVRETHADDLLLVQINPTQRNKLPTSASDILDRVNEVTFNASLIKEIRTIGLLQQALQGSRQPHPDPLLRRMASLRLHRLDADAALGSLGVASKSNTQWAFLSHLFDEGRAAADAWMVQNGQHLGQRGTFRPAEVGLLPV